jgi:hypothetical protein
MYFSDLIIVVAASRTVKQIDEWDDFFDITQWTVAKVTYLESFSNTEIGSTWIVLISDLGDWIHRVWVLLKNQK